MVLFKRTNFGEIILHSKRILKMLCHYKWKTWCKLLSNSRLKIFVHIPIVRYVHQTSFWRARNIMHKHFWKSKSLSNNTLILKRNESTNHCIKSVRIWSSSGPYFLVFSPNAGKSGPEKLWILILFTQWMFLITLVCIF